jgi:formylglycine-generating enzyme required for sulfatase activity
MAFRPVATGKPPKGVAGLPPELQRLYGVTGRFDPFGEGTGHMLIGKYEVTRLQYQSVQAMTRGLACPNRDDRSALPQAEVNRHDAEGFTADLSQWLDEQKDKLPACTTGLTPCLPRVDGVGATVRLPSKDEWSFASRGGLLVGATEFAGRAYPMPNGLDRSVIAKRQGGSEAAPIGGLRANPLGLHDTLGNVEEIMLDLYRVDGAPGEIGGYVACGGSFYSEPAEIAVTLCHEVPLLNKTSDTGFRVVAAVPVYTSGQRLRDVQQREAAGKAPAMASEPPASSTPASAKPRILLPFKPDMVELPGGSFLMGCAPGDGTCHDEEKPAHRVSIRPFRMGRYEVTQAQWQTVMGENPARFKGDDRPVEQVSWDDAQAFLATLNTKAAPNKPYRLPTEAEWEYAARGFTQTLYWWGDAIGKGSANCMGCGSRWDGKETAPVGSFKPNRFGLYDTTGNVWEWVQDCWHSGYSGAPADGSEWRDKCALTKKLTQEDAIRRDYQRRAGPLEIVDQDKQSAVQPPRIAFAPIVLRVLRGGSLAHSPKQVRVSGRDFLEPTSRGAHIGLRLAQDL